MLLIEFEFVAAGSGSADDKRIIMIRREKGEETKFAKMAGTTFLNIGQIIQKGILSRGVSKAFEHFELGVGYQKTTSFQEDCNTIANREQQHRMMPVSKSMRAVWGCAEAQINKQTAEGQPLGSAARSLLPTGNSEKEVSMRITLELPDNTVSIKYCTDDGGTYPSDD